LAENGANRVDFGKKINQQSRRFSAKAYDINYLGVLRGWGRAVEKRLNFLLGGKPKKTTTLNNNGINQ